MRMPFLTAACVMALAACNPSAPGPSSSVFPDLTGAAYRAEAVVSHPDGTTMPVVMMRDGVRQRMEVAGPQGQSTIISNGETGETFILTSAGGQVMAMRASGEEYSDPARTWGGEVAATATYSGSCSVAGQPGSEWTRDVNGVANTVCVTDDGIVLSAAEGETTTWQVTSLERGRQDPAMFEVPEGAQVLDLNAMGAAMNEAMERAMGGQ